MPVQTQTVLKSYFETGDTPTEQQFADLIDTFFFHNQEALQTAADAEAVAAAADTRAPSCLLKWEGGLAGSIASQFNVASVTFPGSRYRVNFTSLIPVPYVVLVTPHVTVLGLSGLFSWQVIENANDHCDIRFLQDPNITIFPDFSLTIYEVAP